PAAADPIGKPAPERTRKEKYQALEHDRQCHQSGAEVQILLEIGRKQRADRVADDKGAGHPPARSQRVAEHASLEDAEQRYANLAVLGALQPPVFDPDLRLFDEEP